MKGGPDSWPFTVASPTDKFILQHGPNIAKIMKSLLLVINLL